MPAKTRSDSDAGSDGEYVPDSSPKKKPKASKKTPGRRRLHRGRNPNRTPSPTKATPEKATQPASGSSNNPTTPVPSIQYEDPPVRAAGRKARISMAKLSLEEQDDEDEEMDDGEPEAEAEGSNTAKSSKKGKKKATEPEPAYFMKEILDERGKKSYLAKWEPNWQHVKRDNDAHNEIIRIWKGLKRLRKVKDYPKRTSWSYLPAHNPGGILGSPYGEATDHFTDGRVLVEENGKGKEMEEGDKAPRYLDVQEGIAWMEKYQGDIERELVRHLFDEEGRNGGFGHVIFPVVNDKARGSLLLQSNMEDPKSQPFAIVRSEIRKVKDDHLTRLIPPFLPNQTSESPSFTDLKEKEIRITLMANPLHWGDKPLLPAVPCGALALRGLEVLKYQLLKENNIHHFFWPRSFNVFNLLVDALITKVCDPPGHPGFSFRTREKGDIRTTLNNDREMNANALTDVRCMPTVELLGYDDTVRWWTFQQTRNGEWEDSEDSSEETETETEDEVEGAKGSVDEDEDEGDE